ncbi:MAG: ATP-binding protein, partial [Deltaproteobacteria bacterium]
MKNPFEYGGVVSGDAFCNREKEISDLLRVVENNEKVFLFSERRYGKTSLVRTALGKLPKKGCVCAYVDLWPTDSEATFVVAAAKAIAESTSTSVDKVLETAKRFFGSLAPSVTVDEEGKPVLTFGISKHAKLEPALDEVLETPAKIAAKGQLNVVVVFDEFQQILEYGNDQVERKLRSVIQNHRDVGYIFLGSRKHLIQKMF